MKFDLDALTIQTFVTSAQSDKSGYTTPTEQSTIPNPDDPDCPPPDTTTTR
jgi:hypothetical protein